jgi:protein TonB
MAYYDQRTGTSERAVAAGLVAVLQVGVMVALIHGLAVVFIPRETPPSVTGEQINLPPPPATPKRQPSDNPTLDKTSTRDAADSPVRTGQNDTVEKVPTVGPSTDGGTTTADPPPPPLPPSGFGRMAKPVNKPGAWVTQNDYSPSDIRSERQGTARFTLGIGIDGKVTSCTILQSTGFDSLDAATCKFVSRRARFEAALDDSGAPIAGSYMGSIRWVIPE